MVDINHGILRWARVTAGLTIEEACKKLHIDDTKNTTAIERLNKIEEGLISPSRTMLLNMANQYHRPLITFYLEKPPQKGNQGQDFRTLPKGFSQGTDALVGALIRDVFARQSIIRANLEDEEEIAQLPFVNSMKISDGKDAFVASIIDYLDFDLKEFRKRKSLQYGFRYLRNQVEAKGIFVLLKGDLGSHHTDLGVDAFRGFAISDNIAPFIVLNDNDSKAALSFTLFHELVHIWLGHTGISNSFEDNSIEKFCNDVAGEILLPTDDLLNIRQIIFLQKENIAEIISDFAGRNNISGSMVAYKAYLTGIISKSTWEQLNNYFHSLWLENKKTQKEEKNNQGKPDYFIIRRYQNGKNLTTTVQRMLYEGLISSTKASRVLGIKPNNLHRLLDIPTINKLRK